MASDPDDLSAVFKAAVDAQRAGRLADAEPGYRAVLTKAEHIGSLTNLALICDLTGRADEAEALCRRAVAAAPDDAAAQASLATHLRRTRQFEAAEAAYRRLLALDASYPNAAFNLGCVLVAMGRFAEGWPLYETRRARRRMLEAGLSFPEWRGEPLAGRRLLVWNEQGYGDQILMARFLAHLEGAQVTYAGPAALERLFAALPVDYQVVRPGVNAAGGYDGWILPCSLPLRLGMTSAQTLPAPPYLAGQAAARGARLGIVWRGEAQNDNNLHRSLTPEAAQRLLALPGAVSLEPQDTGAADFQATADIVAGLDLVISADTAVAHLSAAMGRPTWVLLARHALDWQWPREGASPWYPQARLFVQPTPGDWQGVVDEVLRELSAAGLAD